LGRPKADKSRASARSGFDVERRLTRVSAASSSYGEETDNGTNVTTGVSQTRLGELRNRAVEAMRFAPSWVKQIRMPNGTSPSDVLPVVGSFEELYRIAQIAALNGQPTEEIFRFFADGREEVRVLELSSCEQRAIVTTNDRTKTHTISLRGTKNLKNVAQNLRVGTAPARLSDDVPVPMHRGYRNIAKRCLEAFEPILKDGYKIELTGHSLGGAAAVALALLYHREGKRQVSRVVTFGAPKLGPKETAEAIEDLDILRVVQKDDIIPLLPMSRPFVRRPYCHLGEGILLDNDKPGVFADLPREWGAAGILWRQRMSIDSVLSTSRSPNASGNETSSTNSQSSIVGAARRAKNSFMAAFSMPTNEIELEDEVQDMIEATTSKDSFLSIQEEFDASASQPLGSFDDDFESKTLSVGPTIFERLWALRQFSREERIQRLDSHRMFRYVDVIKKTIDARPTRVQLAEIYDPKPAEEEPIARAPPQLSDTILSIRAR